MKDTRLIPLNDTFFDQTLEMMENFNAIDNYPFDRNLAKQNLQLLLNEPFVGKLWLIEHASNTVGYVVLAFGFSFQFGGKDGLIDELFIKEEFRGQGLGSKAIKLVIQESRALNLYAIHLEVEDHNEIARSVYNKLGFRDNGRILMSIKVK